MLLYAVFILTALFDSLFYFLKTLGEVAILVFQQHVPSLLVKQLTSCVFILGTVLDLLATVSGYKINHILQCCSTTLNIGLFQVSLWSQYLEIKVPEKLGDLNIHSDSSASHNSE